MSAKNLKPRKNPKKNQILTNPKRFPKNFSSEDKLNEYFEEIEQKYGIEVANKTRQKMNSAKELSDSFRVEEWQSEFNQMISGKCPEKLRYK